MNKIFKANLLAGLLPGVLVPILFPIVDFFRDGAWPDWGAYSGAAPSIAIGGVICGVFLAGTLGTPVLIFLEKLNLNKPLINASLGALLGILISLLFLRGAASIKLIDFVSFLAMFGLVGFICGYFASKLSLINKSSNKDAASGASS